MITVMKKPRVDKVYNVFNKVIYGQEVSKKDRELENFIKAEHKIKNAIELVFWNVEERNEWEQVARKIFEFHIRQVREKEGK